MLPLGPPDEHGSPYKSASAFAASPGLLAEPAAPVTAAERARLPRARRGLDRGLDRVRRAEALGRPGALRPRVGGAAGVRRRARRAADRRRPDLRRRRLGRRSSPIPRSSSAGAVAGVPPDAFTDKGQLWGNPLYDWPALRRPGLRVVDRALPAHLRALRPRADRPLPRRSRPTGRCRPTPSTRWRARGSAARARAPFDAAREALGELPLIAEDLGVITPPVTRLRSRSGCRAWRCCSSASRRPSATPSTCRRTTSRTRSSTPAPTTTTRSAAGTTALAAPSAALVDEALASYGIAEPEPHWALIRLAFASPARIAMIQLQDVLGLGTEGRMNQPGTVGGWGWQARRDPVAGLAARLCGPRRRRAGRIAADTAERSLAETNTRCGRGSGT